MAAQSRKRILSALLAVCLGVGTTAAASEIDDGVRPVCDEAYYATTDYYGNLSDGSVVKSYVLNGTQALTDYGVYDSVTNLTDGSSPAQEGGKVTFRFDRTAPTHFYFEGKTSAPFRNLPWTLSVHYRLNGVAARAEDLAGKTGLVEINVDALPNLEASDYARNNYILTATAVFNQDDILSLEAPGAQLQLIGNLRAVLFLAFPGEEQHFSIRVGAEDFSFGGLTFMMVPATLSQLEEIAKLSERKEDLEDSYHKLSDSLDTVLDSFNAMKSSLNDTANGLDTLDKARQTVSSGKSGVYQNIDSVRKDLNDVAGALDPIAQEARDASAFVTSGKDAANTLLDTTLQLQKVLSDSDGILETLEGGMASLEGGLEKVERSLAVTVSGLEGVEGGLTDTQSGLEQVENRLAEVEDGLGDTRDGLRDTEDGLGDMEGSLRDVEDGLSDLDRSLKNVEGGLEDLEDGLEDLEDGGDDVRSVLDKTADLQTSLNRLARALDTARISLPDYDDYDDEDSGDTASASALLDQVVSVGQLYALAQSGDEAAFYRVMLGQLDAAKNLPEEQREAVVGLFTNEDLDDETKAAMIEAQGLTTLYQSLQTLYHAESYEDFAALILRSTGRDPKLAPLMARVWTIYNSGEGEKAALELITSEYLGEKIEGQIRSGINRTSGDIAGSANDTLQSIAAPTAQVVRQLSDLCQRLGRLTDLMDDVEDLSETLRDTSGDLRGASRDLRSTLSAIGSASGDLRTTLSALRGTSGSLRETLGALSDTSGELRGTSGALRQTLSALSDTSGALRQTIQDVTGTSEVLRGVSAAARDGSAKLREASGIVQNVLTDADNLRNVLNGYEPKLQQVLSTLGQLGTTAAAAVRDTNRLISATESLAKSAGTDLDAGTHQSLGGLSSTLRKAADSMDSTQDLQDAKDTITDLIEDAWDEYTGDTNNLLLMDATAAAESLTSPSNPAPQSVQILIRTQEIEVPEEDDETAASESDGASADEKPATLLGRIGKMFRDLWHTVSGIFQ